MRYEYFWHSLPRQLQASPEMQAIAKITWKITSLNINISSLFQIILLTKDLLIIKFVAISFIFLIFHNLFL